eukprot:5964114-Karenia_brevis.AAC.1
MMHRPWHHQPEAEQKHLQHSCYHPQHNPYQHSQVKSPPVEATGHSSGGGHTPLADGAGSLRERRRRSVCQGKATAEAMISHPTQTQRM